MDRLEELARIEAFDEGDPQFEEMLERGMLFINYLGKWYGRRAITRDEIGQQDRLGIARAMAQAAARATLTPDTQLAELEQALREIANTHDLSAKSTSALKAIREIARTALASVSTETGGA